MAVVTEFREMWQKAVITFSWRASHVRRGSLGSDWSRSTRMWCGWSM